MSMIIIQYYKSDDLISVTAEKGFESRIATSTYMFMMAFNQIRSSIDKDFELYINTDDLTVKTEFPILSYSNCDSGNSVLIPDFCFLNWTECGISNYDVTCQEIKEQGNKPYIYDKLFWIGNINTHPARQLMLNLYGNNENFEFCPMQWTPPEHKGEKTEQTNMYLCQIIPNINICWILEDEDIPEEQNCFYFHKDHCFM